MVKSVLPHPLSDVVWVFQWHTEFTAQFLSFLLMLATVEISFMDDTDRITDIDSSGRAEH